MIDTIKSKDCLEGMQLLEPDSVDMVYLDPPFFTNKNWSARSKEGLLFEFSDKWDSLEDYIEYLRKRLVEVKRVMKDSASCFIHCDATASHYIKVMADSIFGMNNFKREIIWNYRKWSNSSNNLLSGHQVILFYGKTARAKFNTILEDYAESTNIDQLMQQREKDSNGKTVYKRDNFGDTIVSKPKKGVPLSDVWPIPYLNPKAKERCGYPTQKPMALLCRLIELTTGPNDVVLDPFCGSGTTLVASKLLGRHFIGFDINPMAVELAYKRLDAMIVSKSTKRLPSNRFERIAPYLEPFNYKIIHRNKSADALIFILGESIPIKVQLKEESLENCMEALNKFILKRNLKRGFLIKTAKEETTSCNYDNIIILEV